MRLKLRLPGCSRRRNAPCGGLYHPNLWRPFGNSMRSGRDRPFLYMDEVNIAPNAEFEAIRARLTQGCSGYRFAQGSKADGGRVGSGFQRRARPFRIASLPKRLRIPSAARSAWPVWRQGVQRSPVVSASVRGPVPDATPQQTKGP